MQIGTLAQIEIAAPREAVFELASNGSRVAEFFRGYGPIPAIERVEIIGGGQTRLGARRHVHNSDGSILEEEIVEFTPPASQAYKLVSGFKPPFSLLVTGATARWAFESRGSSTFVTWRFDFDLTSPLAWLIAAPLVLVFFRGALQRCLDGIRKELEKR